MASIRSWLSAVICLLPSASLAATLLASHYSGTIYTLDLAVTNGNGTLKVKSTGKAGVTQPAWITFDSEDRILYVNDENWRGRPGGMSALSVKEDGSVTLAASAQTSGGQVHSTLYGGSNGRGFIATTEYDLSTLTTYQLPLTASTQPVEKLKFTMSGRGPNAMRQDRPHPHSVWTDPTGKFLLSADLGADLVRIYRIDATTGKLTECPAAQTGPGDGPRHGAWWAPKAGSTEGLMLYVVNELANSVTVWQTAYPSGDGGCLSLKKTQSAPTYPAGKTAPQGSKAAEVRVAGNFVYASNRNDRTYGAKEDSMATYSIDAASGAIKFLEQTSAHGWFPRTFVINKAGDMVAIGGQTSANVAVVARDVQSGKLGELIATIPLGSPGTVNNEDGLSAVIWDE